MPPPYDSLLLQSHTTGRPCRFASVLPPPFGFFLLICEHLVVLRECRNRFQCDGHCLLPHFVFTAFVDYSGGISLDPCLPREFGLIIRIDLEYSTFPPPNLFPVLHVLPKVTPSLCFFYYFTFFPFPKHRSLLFSPSKNIFWHHSFHGDFLFFPPGLQTGVTCLFLSGVSTSRMLTSFVPRGLSNPIL